MEKITTKPVAKEILMKGSTNDGPCDLFSYDNDSDAKRRALGNLYVVGNIQSGSTDASADDLDVGYVLNLVASLAKREYYANPDMDPKDAFGSSLRKINGVIEEFFKNKNTKINIGIFAIAGDQIHISKLGKFKIILARDDRNIDILNNIELFKKEATQEKEFSNIVSGTIAQGDKLLAYYPSKAVISREKNIKANLISLDQNGFEDSIKEIKKDKDAFGCAALHIDIQRHTELAYTPKIQPPELDEAKQGASIATASVPVAQLASTDSKLESVTKDDELVTPPIVKAFKPQVLQETPRIIPAEFARGRKNNQLATFMRSFQNININPRNKKFLIGAGVAIALIAIVSLRSLVFASPSSKALSQADTQAKTSISTAEGKIAQNDLSGAHSLLLSALSSLDAAIASNGSNSKVSARRSELVKALDNLENATDANLDTIIATIPDTIGKAGLITGASDGGFYIYLDQDSTGSLSKVTSGGTVSSITNISIKPNYLSTSSNYIALLDSNDKKVSSWSIAKSKLSEVSFTGDTLINSDIYQDNLYAITGSGITKITDIATGHTQSTQWLASGVALPGNPALIAVDGNIYVLSENGVLTTYYKGQKKNEFNTAVTADSSSLLLTTDDSPNLYVINKDLKRIYVLSKASGALLSTFKVGAESAISSASLDKDGNVYVLISNKIIKISTKI